MSGRGKPLARDAPTGHQSPVAPTLTAFNGKLWLAYVANNANKDLLVISSADGANWSGDTPTGHQSA